MSYTNNYLNGTNINGKINKVGYCAFSIVMDDNLNKALYVQKFPPMNGTKVPNFESNSLPSDVEFDKISKENFVAFWNSDISYQTNGSWKGGKWGKSNLMTTDRSWMFDSFIGDSISIKFIKQGIIKFNGGKEFNETMSIIPNTENNVWSCNVEWNGICYGVYLTDNIMPQYANDVLFVWKNLSGHKYIKLLTRGNNENVDMPLRMMPGAGEHMEPGADIKVKAGILRAVNEEIGIDSSTLTQCYLLNLGIYDSEGRDPRYWEYSMLIDGKLTKFGMKRGSSTNGYILYLVSNSNDEPKEINPIDTQEVGFKWWAKLDSVLKDYSNDKWMIIDHRKFIPDVISKINEFDLQPKVEIEKSLFNLN
jgi:hypothetical protein